MIDLTPLEIAVSTWASLMVCVALGYWLGYIDQRDAQWKRLEDIAQFAGEDDDADEGPPQ